MFFLTDTGPDVQNRIRQIFRKQPDEFTTSDIAATAKNLLPADYNGIGGHRDEIRALGRVIGKIQVFSELSVEKQKMEARHCDEFSDQLNSLCVGFFKDSPQKEGLNQICR